MASNPEWHYAKNGERFGPVTTGKLKQLASSGELSASDLVWREGWADWKRAETLKGLLDAAQTAKQTPPPIPTASGPKSQPTTANVADTVKSDLNDLVSSTKKAKNLAVAHTRRTQLTKMSLPKVYLALGRDVFANERFREEFSDLYQQIAAKNDEIAKVSASNKERPEATDFKGKLQSGAANLMAQGQSAKLGFQRDTLVRELGKKAFDSHGAEAGQAELISPITSANEEVEKLNTQINSTQATTAVPLWQRIPIAALLCVCCFPIGLYLVWSNPRLSSRSKAIWIGGFACVMVLGMIITRIENEAAKAELAAATQLWDAGDKPAAISKYRAVVKSHLRAIPESERSLVMGRLIDFDADSGNESSVDELLKIAEEQHIVPSISSEKARTLQSERVTEQKKVAESHSPDNGGHNSGSNETEVITEDFYPFTPGSMRQTVKVLHLGEMKIQSRQEINHESGGTICTRTVEMFMVPTTGVYLPNGDAEFNRYQNRNGFIEIGSRFENDPWYYEPVLKIGAKVGDSWKGNVVSSFTYTVLPFIDKEVGKQSVRCAVIEMTINDKSGNVMCKVTTAYGRGIGPVDKHSMMNDNGTFETIFTERWAFTLKN